MRYRAYAMYSRLAGTDTNRQVRGGSFLLRMLRRMSKVLPLDTIVPIGGIDGLTVFADFNDQRILEVIHEIRGENPEFAVMQHLLSPGDTFIDVGANYGTFSLLASRLVGDHGHVIAIEPQQVLTGLIARSIAESNVTNCEIINAACGADHGVAELFIPLADSGRAGSFSRFSARGQFERVQVRTVTLDELVSSMKNSGSVVLKVDVEGSEIDVLRGARNLIAARRPAIVIEINPWSAAAADRSPGDLLETLRGLGYAQFASMESFPHFKRATEIDLSRQSNIVARI